MCPLVLMNQTFKSIAFFFLLITHFLLFQSTGPSSGSSTGAPPPLGPSPIPGSNSTPYVAVSSAGNVPTSRQPFQNTQYGPPPGTYPKPKTFELFFKGSWVVSMSLDARVNRGKLKQGEEDGTPLGSSINCSIGCHYTEKYFLLFKTNPAHS